MSYGYYDYGMQNSSFVGTAVWTILAFVFAIIGGILVYVLFLNSKKNLKLTKFLSWLKDFLNFKIMLTEIILKVLYLILTIFVILFSFNFIGTNFLAFLLVLVLGPVIIRIVYESILMFIMIWKNTNEINKKLKK